jgi:predicted DNA-binding protein YlxM (UPF0122 family)
MAPTTDAKTVDEQEEYDDEKDETTEADVEEAVERVAKGANVSKTDETTVLITWCVDDSDRGQQDAAEILNRLFSTDLAVTRIDQWDAGPDLGYQMTIEQIEEQDRIQRQAVTTDGGVERSPCPICGEQVHYLPRHLRDDHSSSECGQDPSRGRDDDEEIVTDGGFRRDWDIYCDDDTSARTEIHHKDCPASPDGCRTGDSTARGVIDAADYVSSSDHFDVSCQCLDPLLGSERREGDGSDREIMTDGGRVAAAATGAGSWRFRCPEGHCGIDMGQDSYWCHSCELAYDGDPIDLTDEHDQSNLIADGGEQPSGVSLDLSSMDAAARHLVDRLAEQGLLTERQATVFVLRRIERESRQAVADELDISKSGVDGALRDAESKIEQARDTIELLDDVAGRGEDGQAADAS